MPSYTAGTAYVRIAPSMTGFHASLRAEIRGIHPEPEIEVRIRPVWRGGPIPPIPDQTVNVRADVDRGAFNRATALVGGLGSALSKLVLPAALIGAAPIIGAIGAAAATSAGAVLVLPAALTAAAIAVQTVKLGVQGLGEAFKVMDDPAKFAEAIAKLAPNARAFALEVRALAPAWAVLKLDVQNALFREMGDNVSNLGRVYIPVLRTGLTDMAASLNLAAHGVTDFLLQANRVRDVERIFGNSSASARILAGVADSLVGIFIDIASVGSAYLPGIAEGFAGAARRGAEYVSVLRDTGQLNVIIENGLQAIRDLGQLFSNVGQIIGVIWTAANAAGGGFLGTMIAVTGEALRFVQSAEGMAAITAIFTALRGVITALLPAFGILLGAVAQAATILLPILPVVAQALAGIVTAVAPLLPVLARVASVIIGVLATALQIVTPIIQVLAEIVGTILLEALRALEPVFVIFGDVLRAQVPVIIEIARTLGGVLVQAVRTIAPFLPPLARAVGDLGIAMAPVIVFLVKMAAEIIGALLPAVGPLLTLVTRLISEAFVPLIPPLIQIAEALLPGMILVINLLVPVISFLAGILGDVLVFVIKVGLIPAIQALADILSWLTEAFQAAGPAIATVWTDMGAWISQTWNGIILPVFNAIVDFIRNVLEVAFNVLWTVVRIAIGAIGLIITIAWNVAIKPIWDAMVAFMNNVLGPVFVWLNENVITPVWNAIQTVITVVWNFIRDNIWNPIVAFIRGIFEPAFKSFETQTTSAWTNTRDAINAVWVSIRDTIWNPMVNFVTVTIPDAFRAGTEIIGQVWDNIKKTMRDPVQAVIDVVYNGGIVASWNAIADFIGLGGQKLAPFTLPQYAAGGPVTRPTALVAGEAGPEYILSAPAVRNLGGITAVDTLHSQASRNNVFRDLQAGRLVEGADHDGPGARRTGFGGVQPHVAMAGHYLAQRFGIGSVGGVGGRPNASDHPGGLALDFMTRVRGAEGDALAGFLAQPANWAHFAIKYLIWRQRILNAPGGGWRNMADRGSITANHYDHVHASFLGEGGAGGGAPAFDPLGFVLEKFGDLGALLGNVTGLAGPWLEIVKGYGGKIFNTVKDFAVEKVTGWAASALGAAGNFVGNFVGTAGGSSQDAVRAAASRYGWGSGPEWNSIAAIVQRESGWNAGAQNPTSTAYGLFQFLNGTWGATGIGKTADPGAQSEAGMRYIRQRYGSPLAALRFRNANGWYDDGGIASGRGIMMKDIISPERVLSSRQTRAFEGLVTHITGAPSGTRLRGDRPGDYDGLGWPRGDGGPFIGSLTVPVPDGSTIDDTLDAVFTRARHERRVGSRYSRAGAR